MKKFMNILLLIFILTFMTGCSLLSDLHVHTFDGSSTGASIANKCTQYGCTVGKLPPRDDYYDKAIKYNFDEEVITNMANIETEILDIIDESTYEKENSSKIIELGEKASDLLKEYETLYDEVVAQYQYAYILYDVNDSIKNSIRLKRMDGYVTEVEGSYNKILYLLYTSKLKDYVLKDYTANDFKYVEREYNAYQNEELVTLINEVYDLVSEAENNRMFETSNKVVDIYGKIVEKNNQIAKIYKYNSYIEYAYETQYMRDYTYQESLSFCNNVKKYFVPAYDTMVKKYEKLVEGIELSDEDYAYYDAIVNGSFFNNSIANETVNEYLQIMKDGNKLDFYFLFNSLFSEGNYYLGEYEGAYEWYVPSFEKPIVFWGTGYRDPFTVVHEFGHYVNDSIYRNENQSYDLLETHSQGNELMYLYYLRKSMSMTVYDIIRTYMLLLFLENILISSAVNVFEVAVYTNEYNGKDSAIYLQDNKITSNEYNDLFESILSDYNLSGIGYEPYWRYAAIFNACYYISYATSAVTSLQIFAKNTDTGFESAREAYFKLFTYNDVNKDYTYKQVLDYAGLYHYNDEKTFKLIISKI